MRCPSMFTERSWEDGMARVLWETRPGQKTGTVRHEDAKGASPARVRGTKRCPHCEKYVHHTSRFLSIWWCPRRSFSTPFRSSPRG